MIFTLRSIVWLMWKLLTIRSQGAQRAYLDSIAFSLFTNIRRRQCYLGLLDFWMGSFCTQLVWPTCWWPNTPPRSKIRKQLVIPNTKNVPWGCVLCTCFTICHWVGGLLALIAFNKCSWCHPISLLPQCSPQMISKWNAVYCGAHW